MRALVIDDSRATRAILSAILRDAGFEVLAAQHGREALSIIEAKGAPDLALVDWNMPEMNGLEFVRTVRGDSRYSGLPLIVVTTETGPAQVAAALEAGANEYLMKPFTKEMLLDKLALVGLRLP